MPAPSDHDASKAAKRRLTEACHTKDTSVRLAWAITVCEAILLGIIALALVDYWLMLPVALRSLGATGLALLAAIGVIRLVRFYRRPTALKEAALDLESERPEIGCEISTAAEYLAGERKPTHEYEPELVAALEKKAAEKLTNSQVPYKRKLLRPALLLAATSLLVLIAVLLAPAGLTALQRTALPFSKTAYTKLTVQPGNVEVPVGKDVPVTNIFSGRLPKNPEFHWQVAGIPAWQTVALVPSTGGVYLHSLTNIRSDVKYRVTGNDAASPEYKITSYVPPDVKALNIEVTYPAYTKLNPGVQKSPDIAAVRASTARIEIEPSVELARAKLRFSALPEMALTGASNGSWTATLKIVKDTDYWIELADRKGHLGVNEKPYHIKALPDAPPKVEVIDPGGDSTSTATNRVPIKISVTDDFGVGDINVVFHKLGGSEVSIPAKRESDQNGEITASAELDLSALELRDYELVAYHAEATDNNTLDGPGIGKSPVYFVEVTHETGAPALSQTQSKRVNLLVVQKQIIADTTALDGRAPAREFDGLAARQRDAAEFGRIYSQALSGNGAPAAATREMQEAIKAMEEAGGYLQMQQRSNAVPSEEGALAHLYQVLKQMPELENLPTTPRPGNQPPPSSEQLRVVLEAIQQQKKEPRDTREIEEALEAAKDLARSQAGLNSALRQTAARDGQSGAPKPGRGKGQGQGQGNGEPGASQNGAEPPPSDTPKPDQLAEKENELSREAAALAARLQRLAGKDSRLGHNAGSGASRAASKIAAAAQAMKQGSFGPAGEHGFQGELALRSVIDQLERILQNRPDPSDVASEDFPKEYEALISEYLKKLSHAE